jgi:hypothetical protein|tara:strand:- start:677 stop:913 length:237 start_codon:yes stop_codon:yes gene_type:complete
MEKGTTLMTINNCLPYPLPPEKFAEACSEIFGSEWRKELSEKIRVDYRSVKNWETGRVKVPGSVVFALNVVKNHCGRG